MKKLMFVCLLLSACSVMPYRTRQPGTINKVDSEAYTKLIQADATAREGQAQLVAGALPDLLRTPLVHLQETYNSAMAAYKVWHEFNVGNPNAKLSPTLQLDMDQLDLAMYGFTGKRP